MTELIDRIRELLLDEAGVLLDTSIGTGRKKEDLVISLTLKLNQKTNHRAIVGEKPIRLALRELVSRGDLLEIEYIIPSIPFEPMSMLLPAGSRVVGTHGRVGRCLFEDK